MKIDYIATLEKEKCNDCLYREDNNCIGNLRQAAAGCLVNFMIEKLEADKVELLESFKNLLTEAKYLYLYDPNNFRTTVEEYFKSEIDLIQKMEENIR